MLRRWLIRLPFLWTLAFLVALWITSYFWGVAVECRAGGIGVVQGLGIIGKYPEPIGSVTEWEFFFQPHATAQDCFVDSTVFGFHYGTTKYLDLQIVFPLWLPTLFLAALTWFVWRKTRPKAIGKPFPIEPSSSSPTTNHEQ